MVRIVAWLTLAVVWLVITPAWSAPAVRTTVGLAPAPGGIVASYTLSLPVERFRFETAIADIRAEGWVLANPLLTLDGDTIVAKDGKPFRDFALHVKPDSRQRDRIYPALTRIGPEGWVIYEPHFAGKADDGPSVVKVPSRRGWTSLPAAKIRARPDSSGFVYFGPAAYVSGEVSKVVSGPGIPAWLLDAIRADAAAATAFFSRRLGVALPWSPLVVVSHEPGPGTDFRGDVTNGRVVSMRFYGTSWETRDPAAAARTGGFVAHEYFHFWNGGVFNSADAEGAAWLHEGAAEYAARLSAMSAGHLDDAGMAQSLGSSLTNCAATLGDRGMRANGPKRGNAVYDCGVVVQWIADLQTRSASGGDRDVLDLWRMLFANTGATKTYDTAAFVAAAGAAAGSPLERLLAPGKDRWPQLVEGVRSLGARVTATRSDAFDRQAIFFHLLNELCSNGSYGFYEEPTGVKLDSGDRCGPLSGDPLVDAVEGRSIVTEIRAAFDAVTSACAAGRDVTLLSRDKVVATVPCAKPLGPPTPAWTVEKWR